MFVYLSLFTSVRVTAHALAQPGRTHSQELALGTVRRFCVNLFWSKWALGEGAGDLFDRELNSK